MVKNTQTTRRQQSAICLSVFDYFVGLARKELNSATQVVDVRQEQFITVVIICPINYFICKPFK